MMAAYVVKGLPAVYRHGVAVYAGKYRINVRRKVDQRPWGPRSLCSGHSIVRSFLWCTRGKPRPKPLRRARSRQGTRRPAAAAYGRSHAALWVRELAGSRASSQRMISSLVRRPLRGARYAVGAESGSYPSLRRRILPSKNNEAITSEATMASALAITLVVDGGPAPSPLGVSGALYLG